MPSHQEKRRVRERWRGKEIRLQAWQESPTSEKAPQAGRISGNDLSVVLEEGLRYEQIFVIGKGKEEEFKACREEVRSFWNGLEKTRWVGSLVQKEWQLRKQLWESFERYSAEELLKYFLESFE